MKKIMLIGNHAVGLYNFRKEIIEDLLKQDYEVHISTPYNSKIEELKNLGCVFHGLYLDRRGKNPLKELTTFYRYYKLIKKVNPDVILSYTIKPNLYGGLVARILKKPFIPNVTGMGSVFYNESLVQNIVIKIYKQAFKKVRHVFFQNEYDKSVFIEKKIVNESQTILIPGSGVNTGQFIPMEMNVDSDEIRFLFLGRLMTTKGVNEFLNMAKRVKEKYPKASFGMYGFFDDNSIEEKVKAYESNGWVKYCGYTKNPKLAIAQYDCIVLPSYYEGMSNVLLEGGAMGKPLITTDIPGCKEAVVDGLNGYLCKKGDVTSLVNAVIKICEMDKNERREMGRKSRELMVEKFDRKIIINAYNAVIGSIMKSG